LASIPLDRKTAIREYLFSLDGCANDGGREAAPSGAGLV
jgi:hypothetical protein